MSHRRHAANEMSHRRHAVDRASRLRHDHHVMKTFAVDHRHVSGAVDGQTHRLQASGPRPSGLSNAR